MSRVFSAPARIAFALLLAAFLSLAPGSVEAVRFRFPIDNADGQSIWSVWVIGADHDPAPGANRSDCLSYLGFRGFPFCYDDHDGTDYLLMDAFSGMDAGSAPVLAAAEGVVTFVQDGNYDRCHGDLASGNVTCDGHEMRPNYVEITHDDGYRSTYVHMKKDSILVAEGERVRCGHRLGLIGSSGYSSAPHLHFEVVRPDGEEIDPYAGPESQPESLWMAQDGPHGLPAERCEGDEPPPDAVEPIPDVPDLGPARSDIVEPAAPDTDAGEGPLDAGDGRGPDGRRPDGRTSDVLRAPPGAGASAGAGCATGGRPAGGRARGVLALGALLVLACYAKSRTSSTRRRCERALGGGA